MLIVADDLTGAADCGVACAAAGLGATVWLGPSMDDGYAETDVVAIDVDTRRMSASEAACATEQAVRQHLRAPRQLLYKKFDSTLRGHLAAELMACLRGFRAVRKDDVDCVATFAVVAPAFPALGRTTLAGRQFVEGVPLHETELWKREGLESSTNLVQILRDRGMTAEVVGLEVVRSGPELLSHILKHVGRTADAVICDAETDDDLRAVAIASLEPHPAVMWAGSAGLAHQLLLVAGLDENQHRKQESGCVIDGPTLFVVGSWSSISRAQVDVLSQDRRVHRIDVAPGVLRNEDPSGRSVCEGSICSELRKGRDVVVHICGDGDGGFCDGPLLARALAKVIEPCANAIGALVLTGGETAREVLDVLGVKTLRLMGEVEPGLPFAVAEFRKTKLPVLTKAGAFGTPESLVRCRQFLQMRRASAEAPGEKS